MVDPLADQTGVDCLVVIGSMSIAAGCLGQSDPLVGLMSCTALAVPGGYIAFFHTARYMLVNVVFAVAIGAWEALSLASAGDPVLAVSGYVLVLELNIGVPFAIQIVVRALGADLLRSDRDPLTGLLNRRAFTRAVVNHLGARTDGAFLAVAMLDLDRFKAINDSRGHAGGDAVLVAVAQALTGTCTDAAFVCRMGGEAFAIAEVVSTAVPTQWAQRLRTAVESSPTPVTASVGTATVALDVKPPVDDQTFQQLLADAAMYVAKWRGGNQTQHAIGESR